MGRKGTGRNGNWTGRDGTESEGKGRVRIEDRKEGIGGEKQ